MKRGPGSLGSHLQTPRSSRHLRPPGSHRGRLDDDLKKRASGGAECDSESEESGYGDTYYTMQQSSFDTTDVFGSVTLDTMRGTPIGLDAHSDADSSVSYITGDFPQANPEDLCDAFSQTPGHATTQTPGNLWTGSQRSIGPREIQTQTLDRSRSNAMLRSNMSLQSVGSQTGRRSTHGSRSDLLKSILSDVKAMKVQRGLGVSPAVSDESFASRANSQRDLLNTIGSDVRTLREMDATGNQATQTIEETGTQTGHKMFPEGDPVHKSRRGRLQGMMDELKTLKGGDSNRQTPADTRSRHSSMMESPFERSRPMSSIGGTNRNSPVRIATPVQRAKSPSPLQNGYPPQQNGFTQYSGPPAGAYRMLPTAPMMMQEGMPGVTQDEINAVGQRIQQLARYQIPPRRQLPPPPPPPPPPPQYVVPVFAAPPRQHVRFDDDGWRSDDSEYDGGRSSRKSKKKRGRGSHLDSALDEVNDAAQELKFMSKKMRDSLRDELMDLPY